MVHAGVSAAQQVALTDAALRGWALGGQEFVAELQKQTDRRATQRQPGRPLSRKGSSNQ